MKCEYCNNELVWEGNFQNGRLVCHRCEEVEWQPDDHIEGLMKDMRTEVNGHFDMTVAAGGAGYASSHGSDIVVIGGGGGGGGKIARGGQR